MNENKTPQFVETDQTNNRLAAQLTSNEQTITGLLTSRIEAKKNYYYGFFKLEGYEQEIPVIFKESKPTLTKGSTVLLEGTWSQGEERPSFTCSDFKIINSTEPLKEANHKLNIYQKLQVIQANTGAISKTELNKFQNYKYFTEQQALNILKPLLAEQKLTLTFSDSNQHFTSEKSEKDWAIRYLKQAILTNSEKPEEQLTFHFWAIGSNSDPAKAKGCAETYAIKYFLTKFFLIPTTDTLDPDFTKDHEHANRLKNGKQETPEQIQLRHQNRDLDLIIKKHGLRYQATPEYQQWKENYGVNRKEEPK